MSIFSQSNKTLIKCRVLSSSSIHSSNAANLITTVDKVKIISMIPFYLVSAIPCILSYPDTGVQSTKSLSNQLFDKQNQRAYLQSTWPERLIVKILICRIRSISTFICNMFYTRIGCIHELSSYNNLIIINNIDAKKRRSWRNVSML